MDIADDSLDPFYLRFGVGCICGAIGGFVSNPAEIVKARVQSGRHNYSGPINGTVSIIQKEGAGALFTGANASIVRCTIGTSSNLVSFSYMKDFLQGTGWFSSTPMPSGRRDLVVDCTSGMFSGTFLSVCMNPVDNVRTRLYNQPKNPDGTGKLYKSMSDALRKIARVEGTFALFKGLAGNIARQGPHMCLVFTFKGILERQLGIYSRPKEIGELWTVMDADEGGSIDWKEARNFFLNHEHVSEADVDSLYTGFDAMDTNHDHVISREEFMVGLESLDYIIGENLARKWTHSGVGVA